MSTQQDTYRSVKGISNSLMGVYEDDFRTFVRYWVYDMPLPDKKDDSLILGSAIDTLLTTPEEFNKRFIVYNGVAPKGQMLSFCNALASVGINDAQTRQMAYNQVGFKRDDLKKVEERFKKEGTKYYNYLLQSSGKAVLTVDQVDKANRIVEELTHGKYTRPYVIAKTRNDEKGNIQVIHQMELFNTLQMPNGLELNVKGALDKVIINHDKKLITPIDYKSSYNVEGFKESYFKWRYYRQGSFYTYLLGLWAKENGMEDYEIAPFRFVVCSTMGGKHYIYQMDRHDIHIAKTGGETRMGLYIKGWEQILVEISKLTGTDWDYPYEVVSNGGVIPLNIFK